MDNDNDMFGPVSADKTSTQSTAKSKTNDTLGREVATTISGVTSPEVMTKTEKLHQPNSNATESSNVSNINTDNSNNTNNVDSNSIDRTNEPYKTKLHIIIETLHYPNGRKYINKVHQWYEEDKQFTKTKKSKGKTKRLKKTDKSKLKTEVL